MDILIQSLVNSYPKYVIEKQISSSYVNIYSKNNAEIILVYSKNRQNNVVDNIDKKSKNEYEELELTGSPLVLDLSLHTILDDTLVSDEPQIWRKDETLHAPIEIEKARTLCDHFNEQLDKVSKNDAIPMWVLCKSNGDKKPLLLCTHSDEDNFGRGIVTYEGASTLEEIDVESLITDFAEQEGINEDLVTVKVDSRIPIAGVSYGSCTVEEQLNAPYGGVTELHCEWNSRTVLTPFISCKVNLEQELIIGHLASPCNIIWKSVCSLHTINQLLVDMTAAGFASMNLETTIIRHMVPGMKRINNTKRLNNLLNEVELYSYTAECPAGGCVCVSEDTTSLRHCMSAMNQHGSSNDFTYKLWDILRDCETAEELITLLLDALKFISSGKVRPFIDVNNKSFLSKLVLKLSRGHSQTSKVLKNLRASPPQALSLAAQVGMEKTMWEYMRVMSLLEQSFFIAGIWNTDIMSYESIEQINQTIHDMTMGGEYTLNPFETLGTAENSIRLDSESFCTEDPNELTVDDFASLKKHGLVNDKKDVNEVPLIADEIDISGWKTLLMKFAQVHVCLEHLYRAETCLRTDFAQLKPIASRLLEHYVSEKSSVKTVGQLMSDPIQRVCLPIANNVVRDHIKKPVLWYRMEMNKNENSNKGLDRQCKIVYVFSQQAVFPPQVWQYIEPPSEDVAETTTVEELKYHSTKYIYLNNKVKPFLELP